MIHVQKRKRGRPAQPYADYRRVGDDLRRRFAANEWPPGSALPSLRTLAREYKVSLDTFRAAMNMMRKEDRVSLSGLRRLTVTPLMSVKPVIEPKRAILLAITTPLRLRPEDLDANQLLLGMLQGAADLQAPLIVTQCYTLRTAPPFGFLQLSPRGILILGSMEPEGYGEYEKLPLPVVVVDHPVGRRSLHSVCVDNENATRDAVHRLLASGHRRIAFVRRVSFTERDVDPDSRERQSGYKKALLDAGIRYDSGMVFSVFSPDTEDSPRIRAFFEPVSKVTAAVCSDAGTASLVLKAARRHGRTVPRDLSIVCFQGTDSEGRLSGPVIDFFELGRRAARCVDFARRPPLCVRLPCEWRDRGSIRPPPV